MVLPLTVNIVQCNNTFFTGWVEELNGIVAQGETLAEVQSELQKILRIKLRIDLGIKKNPNQNIFDLTIQKAVNLYPVPKIN